MPNPQDGEFGKMPHYCPGGWVLLELTVTLWETVGSLKFLKATKWMVKQPFRACAVSSTVFNSLFESNRNYESKGTENITPVYMYSK